MKLPLRILRSGFCAIHSQSNAITSVINPKTLKR